MPILYDEENFGEKSFTVENVASTQWLNDSLPKNLLPFAIDWGANFFCIDHKTGNIFYFVRDVWSDNISAQRNLEINTRYLTNSLFVFLDGLVFDDEDIQILWRAAKPVLKHRRGAGIRLLAVPSIASTAKGARVGFAQNLFNSTATGRRPQQGSSNITRGPGLRLLSPDKVLRLD